MGQWSVNKLLHFGGDPCPNTDPDPYHDTGKTYPVEGMHCPCASSYIYVLDRPLHGIALTRSLPLYFFGLDTHPKPALAKRVQYAAIAAFRVNNLRHRCCNIT